MPSCNFKVLTEVVLKNSQARVWDEAKSEWSLQCIYDQVNGTCECGHHPILKHCVISNTTTGSQLTIGNRCLEVKTRVACWAVLRFLEMSTLQAVQAVLGHTLKLARDGFQRICKDCGKAPNKALTEVVETQKLLTGKDLEFYKDMKGKRVLSERQLSYLASCNRKVKTGLSRMIDTYGSRAE